MNMVIHATSKGILKDILLKIKLKTKKTPPVKMSGTELRKVIIFFIIHKTSNLLTLIIKQGIICLLQNKLFCIADYM